jgi:hypothetical protein
LRLKLKFLEISKMKKILAVAVATAISAPAMADLTIGASTEFNLSTTDGVASESIETNVTFTGSTTMENGSFAKAFIELEAVDGGDASTALDIDDNYLQIGNAAANVVVGYFGTKSAFNSGDDSFEAPYNTTNGITAGTAAAPQNLYKGNSDDDADDQEIAINITSIEGVDLQVSGNINDASDTDMRAYAGLTVGSVALAANIQSSDSSADDGYAVSASTDLSGVAVAVSYAANDDDDTAVAVTGNMNGFDLTYVRFEDGVNNTSETSYYGSYALGNMGIDGLSVDVGAGSGSDRETKMGVEVIYSF